MPVFPAPETPPAPAAAAPRIPRREELAREDTWDLEALFPTPERWEEDFQRIDALLAPALAFQGKLDSPETIAALFEAEDALSLLIERLYAYAHHREDEDTANATNQARSQRILARLTETRARLAWIEPEILAHPAETLERWRDSPALAPYRYTLTRLLRRKPHTLSEKEETLLAGAAEVFRAPYTAFSLLTNADLKFPDVVDAEGRPQPLSNGRYILFLESRDRATRQRAFEAFYDRYIEFQNTLAATLSATIKRDNFLARARRFGSALEAALHPDHVPVSLYDALIQAVRETGLPAFREYLELRRRALDVEALDMFDMYVPIVPDFDMKISWDEAKTWVRESCRPLGEAYLRGVDEAFASRWVDVYENQGKRSGAYSGGCYGAPSYILMNYQGTLDHVFTLAHELGHSMHSWLANQSQPYRYAEYPIFIAEIASTTNEALLLHYLLERADNPAFRAYLLNHFLDQVKGTVIRQTQFAEFERRAHELEAGGEPLTAQTLSALYGEINSAYYSAATRPDARISREWSRIPHFYYNFYVYKYATGFSAAQVFARRILEGGETRDRYLDLLRAGGSADPLELIGRAGVDLTDPRAFTDVFALFRERLAEFRGLLAPAS